MNAGEMEEMSALFVYFTLPVPMSGFSVDMSAEMQHWPGRFLFGGEWGRGVGGNGGAGKDGGGGGGGGGGRSLIKL